MSWITITEADIVTKLSGPELAAMKTAALQPAQVNPLPEVIEQVIKKIRGYVAACARNTLGDGDTIPDELLGAAISIIRFDLATRLPVPGLLTEDRRTANSQAIAQLKDVARCEFLIVQPATAADDQAGGPGIEVVTKTCRKFSRDDMRGL